MFCTGRTSGLSVGIPGSLRLLRGRCASCGMPPQKKIKAVTMFLSTGELALVGPSLGSSPGQSVLACKTAAVEAWIHFGPLGSRPDNVWCPQIQVLSLRFE